MIDTSTASPLPHADTGQPLFADTFNAEQIRAQLSRAGRRLRFSDTQLEAGFRRFMEQYSLVQVRPALLVLMVLIGLFGLTDLANFPPEVFRYTLALRLLVVVPILAWVYWRTYRIGADSRLYPSLVLAAGITSVSAVALVYIPHSAGLHTPYEGLMLFMFGIGGFMGLRSAYAVSLLVLMSLLYVAAELAAAMPLPILVNSSFRIVCTAVVGGFAAYLNERQARHVYLHRILLESYAHRDGLTGIANRRAFDTHAAGVAQQAARERKPITVMIVDADHFKQYNDTYGHLMGDSCLQKLATAITHSVRRPLDLAARYGGEEFVVLWYDVDARRSQQLAAELQARIERLALPHAGSPVAGRVSVSGGIATRVAGDARPLDDLLVEADQALYQAKAGGRNRFVHFSAPASNRVAAGRTA